MPIVINELIFKATIADSQLDEKLSPALDQTKRIDQKTLVDICVEEVLNILERQKER
jgi:hypothetical protein